MRTRIEFTGPFQLVVYVSTNGIRALVPVVLQGSLARLILLLTQRCR